MKRSIDRCGTACFAVSIVRRPVNRRSPKYAYWDATATMASDRQEHETALQELIPRQAKHVKAQIHSEDRVGKSEGATIAKAQISVPLRIEAAGEHCGDNPDEQRRAPRPRYGERERWLSVWFEASSGRTGCRCAFRAGPSSHRFWRRAAHSATGTETRKRMPRRSIPP